MSVGFYQQFLYLLILWTSTYSTTHHNVEADGSFHIPDYGYQLSGKTVFTFMKKKMTWNEASVMCRTRFATEGGKLAKLADFQAVSLVEELIGSEEAWFGLYYWFESNTKKHLKWDDNVCSRFSYSEYHSFLNGQDDYDNNNRCYYTQNGVWRRQECLSKKYFLCQHQDTQEFLTDCDAYSEEGVNFFTVAKIPVDEAICRALCTDTLGCFFTMVGIEICVLGVVEESNSGYFRKRCYKGRTELSPPSPTDPDNSKFPKDCVAVDETDVAVSAVPVSGNAISGGGGGAGGGAGSDLNNSTVSSSMAPDCSNEVVIRSNTVTVTMTATPSIVTKFAPVTVHVTDTLVENTCSLILPSVSQTLPVVSTVTETPTVTTSETEEATATISASSTAVAMDNQEQTSCPSPSVVATPIVWTLIEYVSLTVSSCLLSPCTTVLATTADIGQQPGCDSGTHTIETICPSASLSQGSTSAPVQGNEICYTPKNVTLEESDLEQAIDSIVQELIVPASSLSQQKRKKASAEDKRVSAKSAGYLAIACLTMSIAAVIVSDIPILYQQVAVLVRRE